MQRVDRGRPARPSVRGPRIAERPLAGDKGGLDREDPAVKSSGLTEALCGPACSGLGTGWEEGARNGPAGRPVAPLSPTPAPAPGGESLAALARRLQLAAAAALGPAGLPASVRVTAAAIARRSGEAGQRRAGEQGRASQSSVVVAAATLLVGADPAAPLWSRTARLGAGNAGRGLGRTVVWPVGWLEAAARETATRRAAGGRALDECAGPGFAATRGALVADAFAAGDLVRLEGMRLVRIGQEPETLTGSLARGARVLERRAPRGWPEGSWRTSSDPPWEELTLEIERQVPWPAEGFVLTRLLPLRGALLGAGHLLRGGVPAARWGPVAIPPPAWWLSRIGAALGDPVRDASGPPVACPPLAITWGRGGGPR